MINNIAMHNSPINNIILKLNIEQAIEESFLTLADTISDILTQYELKNKDDKDTLIQIMNHNNQISAYLDQVLSSSLIQILEKID